MEMLAICSSFRVKYTANTQILQYITSNVSEQGEQKKKKHQKNGKCYRTTERYVMWNTVLTFWRRNDFFLISAQPVYKTWIKQEPNMLDLWNKLHFEEKKTESIYHV